VDSLDEFNYSTLAGSKKHKKTYLTKAKGIAKQTTKLWAFAGRI